MTDSVGFLLHPRERSEGAVTEAAALVEAHGLSTWYACHDAERTIGEQIGRCRLLVTVGGDGTFLLGARLAVAAGVPVLGVNRGQLGFLTDIELAQLPGAVKEWIAGRHRILRRSLLELVVPGVDDQAEPALRALALNEVVVKSTGINLARLRIEADGELLGAFDADGVIIATATGSTAYALSAGGPPVDPRVRAILVVPLAPHAVLHRALVLPEAVTIDVTVVRGRTVVYADGYVDLALQEGVRLAVLPGPELESVQVAGSAGFLRRLREKMRIGLPLKQSVGVHLDAVEES